MGMFDNYDPWAGWGDYRGEDLNNPSPYQPTPDQNLIQEAISAADWSPIYLDAEGNPYREKIYTYANPTAWTTSESGSPVEIGGLGHPYSPEGTSTRKIYEFYDKQGNPIDKGPLGVPVGYDAPSQGGFIDFIQNNGWVVPLALATAGAGLELAGGAGAASGAGTGAIDSTAAALGGSGGGGAFVPTAGSGASFGITPGAAYTVGGGYITPELMGPTYGELGYTGVEGGFAGPTYGELGYTGLNQSEAIAAADAATKGLTLSDVASGLSKAQKLANALKTVGSLFGTSAKKGTPSGMSNIGLQNALSGLVPQQQFGGLYNMNKNPFNFGSQGQTVASEGMYDVSGGNAMANALRKS